ncbi:hypothetical protein CEE36_03775 [candidate division TA06 bacterium B3_TA06]|uniref:Uncharacterized protein n=1 Tax=candidate division TA06 bacterium B3_TA06 TaxID=2012487 RepID=A0A532V8F3_UNCT6|nr:MAG: hypothetical protein CEE36_03775 [candidate division TA06 bacterium B3_TA06]
MGVFPLPSIPSPQKEGDNRRLQRIILPPPWQTEGSLSRLPGHPERVSSHPHKALDYYQKSLEIATKIGNLEVQANQLNNIGALYGNLGDHKQALNYFQRAREIYVKIGAKHKVEQTDQNIARARQKLAEQ